MTPVAARTGCPPRLGAAHLHRLRQRARARRWLAAAIALVALATAIHHLAPMPTGMHEMGGTAHEHATTMPAACAGIVGGIFVLAAAYGVIAIRRPRRRHPARREHRYAAYAMSAGRPPCRDGPPPFLRLQVLRT